MDQINQVPQDVPQQTGAPQPTPGFQPQLPKSPSSKKIWIGIIAGLIIIVTGVFWLFGKPTLFKGELGIIEDFQTYCTSNGGAWADYKCTYKEETFFQKNEMENFIAAEPPAPGEEAIQEALQSAIQNALVPASDVNVLIQQAQTALADANQLIADATTLLGEGKPYDALTKAKNALIKIDEAKTNVGSAIGKINEAKKLAKDPPLNGENTVVNNTISQLEKDFMALPSTIKIKNTADAIISAAEQAIAVIEQPPPVIEEIKLSPEQQEAVKKALESAHQNAENAAALAEEKAEELQAMTKEKTLLQGADDEANAALDTIKTQVNYLKNLLNDFKPNGQEDPIVKSSYEKALVAKSNAEKSYEIIMAALAPKEEKEPALIMTISPADQQTVGQSVTISLLAVNMKEPPPYKYDIWWGIDEILETDSPGNQLSKKHTYKEAGTYLIQARIFSKTDEFLAYTESFYTVNDASGAKPLSAASDEMLANVEKVKQEEAAAKAAADKAAIIAAATPEPPTPTTPTPTPEPAPQTLFPSAPEPTASSSSAGNSGGGGGSFVIPYTGPGGGGGVQTPSIPGGTPNKKASSEEPKKLLGYLETPEMWGDQAKSSTIETPEMWGDATPTAAPIKVGAGATGGTGGTAYGATIQGKTGPGILLYPVVIGAVNGLYYLARKRRKN